MPRYPRRPFGLWNTLAVAARGLWGRRSSLRLRFLIVAVAALAPLVAMMMGTAREEKIQAMTHAGERAQPQESDPRR